jgi:hypothetical protein
MQVWFYENQTDPMATRICNQRASVWRVLSRAGLLQKWNRRSPKKGTGFDNHRSRTIIGISMFPT